MSGPETIFPITADRIKEIRSGKKDRSGKKAQRSTSTKKAQRSTSTGHKVGNRVQYHGQEFPDETTRVSVGVLSYLREMDDNMLFERPVIEQIPLIKDKYLEVVEKPMDFETIEKTRMPSYKSLQE